MAFSRFRTIVLCFVLSCCLLFTGCYEDESTISIKPDGSGTFEHTILLSERMVVGLSSEGGGRPGGDDAVWLLTKEKLEAHLGESATLTHFSDKEIDGDQRLISVKGSFTDAAKFFDSIYVTKTLKLALRATEDGKAELRWVEGVDENQAMSLDQTYGLAKGLKVIRRVELPAKPTSPLGLIDKNTVTWSMDLTDQEALAKTKAMREKVVGGVAIAALFDPGALRFEAEAPDKVTQTIENDGAGLKAELSLIKWERSKELGPDNKPDKSDLDLYVRLTWPEGKKPQAHYGAELISLQDDLGVDLAGQQQPSDRREPIDDRSDSESLFINPNGPASNATALVNLKGQVRVVVETRYEDLILKDPASLIGKPLENATLKKHGLQIDRLEPNRVYLRADAGVRPTTIVGVITATLPDGASVKSSRTFGSGRYSFEEDISGATSITLSVITGETVVKVPFSIDQIDLP